MYKLTYRTKLGTSDKSAAWSSLTVLPNTGSFLIIPFLNKSSMAGLRRKNFLSFSRILFLWPDVVNVIPEAAAAAAPETEVGLVGDGFSSRSSSFEPKNWKKC